MVSLTALLLQIRDDLLAQEGAKVCVAFPDSPSRSFLLEKAAILLQKQGISTKRAGSFDEIANDVGALSLFGEQKVYLLDEVDAVSDLPPDVSCLIATGSKKALPKEGWIVHSYLQEKIWEQRTRIQKWTEELFAHEKKHVTADVLTQLVDRCDNNLFTISQEVKKIATFCSGKATISRSDVQAITQLSHSETEWKIAEDIVWRGKAYPLLTNDMSELYRFFGLLRYQILLGVNLGGSQRPRETAQKLYPKMMKNVDKLYLPTLKKVTQEFFIKSYVALTTLEQQCKTRAGMARHSWDMFTFSLRSFHEHNISTTT